VKVIQKYPELYSAYIGIGQVTDQLTSERIAFDYMTELATERGDNDALRQLSEFDPQAEDFPSYKYLMTVRSPLMFRYGIGMTHKPVSMAEVARGVLMFKGYTLGEKRGYIRGGEFGGNVIFPQLLGEKENFFVSALRFEVPVYVVQGKYDYQVSCELAQKWVEEIEAPDKGFFMFEESAHAPNMEEPEKFVKTVRGLNEE
jgi:pimeloyl-ACP methyl ester carboxylesterase